MMVMENCPICNSKLEPIMTKEGFVSDFFCGKCSLYWTLEDLEYVPLQRNLGEWI